jgi:magnesium transporter
MAQNGSSTEPPAGHPASPTCADDASAQVTIHLMRYNRDTFVETELDPLGGCPVIAEADMVTWINVEGLRDDVVQKFGECFGLHPLVQEDILHTDQRPKLEDYGDYVYIIVKELTYDATEEAIVADQISLILGRRFVLSFQGHAGDPFDHLRDRLRSGKTRIRQQGADYLLHAMLDAVVDNYFVILEKIEDRIDILEEGLITQPDPSMLQQLHNLKRQMIYLRNAVWPLREVLSTLWRRDTSLVSGAVGVYLRDVYDHTIQVMETIETLRDILSGLFDIYLSSISNRLNEIMKLLTIMSTYFIPLTFLAGVYGMNFRVFPEINWPWGYPMFWVLCILIAIGLFIFFKRRKWV